jgi:hypothetical protein
VGAIIAFILSSAVPAIEFGGLSMPSLVGVANACDEFHGDNNCTCQQSIFNPCCPWWKDKSQWDASCFAKPALTQDEKDQLWKDAAKMGQGARLFALIAATFRGFGPDPVAQLIVKAAAAGALGAQWAQVYLEAQAADPDDYDKSDYDAPWWTAEQLGFELCDGEGAFPDYCNAFIWNVPRIQRNGEGAYVSLNRSSGCVTTGDRDCAQHQADVAKWYMREMGDAMRDAGWYLSVLRDNLPTDGYNAECNCWLSQVLYQAAGDFWNSGEYLRNRY